MSGCGDCGGCGSACGGCRSHVLLLTELAGLESLGRSYLSPFGRAEVKGALVRPRLVRQKWRDGALKPMDDQNQR